MKYSGDLTTYTLGGTSYLADFTNVSFKVGANVEEGKGGAQRHSDAVPVKRMFEARTEIMRTVTGARQTSLTMSVANIVATIVAKVRNVTINVNTTLQECSARADEFQTHQATGTKHTGSATLQILDADTTTLFDTLNGSLAGLTTTLSLTVGGVVLVLPILLTGAEVVVERDNLILVNVDFEQKGTPTTATGSTLLTSVLTGTSLFTIVCQIATVGTYTGNSVIESATFTMPEEGIVTEQYNFKGLGQPVKS